MTTYLVRLAGAESNIVQSVEADTMMTEQGILVMYRAGMPVYYVGLSRLVDIRLEPNPEHLHR